MKLKITTLFTLILGFSIAFSSCEKIEVPKGTPKCVKKKIKQEIKEGNELKEVYQYEYNGELVYEFIRCPETLNSGNDCPNTSIGFFLNENCESVCHTSPPFVPDNIPSCVQLHNEGINKKLIWSEK